MRKVLGVPNALAAKQCLKFGFDHLYISGGQLHAFEYGLPDLNILSFDELEKATSKIASSYPKELWVDIDAGECSNLKLSRQVIKLMNSGATGVQIEDQSLSKRCGHRDGKSVITAQLMTDRIKSIKDSCDIKIIARTDALHIEERDNFELRLEEYIKAGADIVFIEALDKAQTLEEIKKNVSVPVLVNRTEFGKTPHLNDEYWQAADYHLLPISLSRIMHKALETALVQLKERDCQEALIEEMLTRGELYDLIDYENYESQYCSLT